MEDYEKHVWDQYNYEDSNMRSWCGEVVGRYKEPRSPALWAEVPHDWLFQGANHAALSMRGGMTTQPCKECAAAIIKALSTE